MCVCVCGCAREVTFTFIKKKWMSRVQILDETAFHFVLKSLGKAWTLLFSWWWLCLSPYVETFNLKVIKRFRTWTKKSLRVFEFRDSCVLRYIYMLPTFDVHFEHSRIWLWNTNIFLKKESKLYFQYIFIVKSFPMHSYNKIIYNVSKVGDRSRGWPEGSLFNCYNT